MNIKLLFFPLSMIVLVWSIISVTKPAWDEYKIQKAETVKLIQEKQGLEKGVMNIKRALVEYRNLDEGFKSYVNNAMPVDGEDENLVAEINKNTSQSGVLITKLNVGEKKVGLNVKCKTKVEGVDCPVKASSMSVDFTATGTYPSIKEFLRMLDIQNRIVRPVSMDLSVVDNNDEEKDSTIQLINANIKFDVFKKDRTKIESFSSVMTSDAILKSLLSSGLDAAGVDAVTKLITSELFRPVQVDGTGKENLFEKVVH